MANTLSNDSRRNSSLTSCPTRGGQQRNQFKAVIPTTGGGTTPPKPPSQEGVKDWVKKQLHNLARLLANLAGKVDAALPGVIGSIVSWLLSATGKVVNWFGNNLWALVVLVAGLLYAAAKEWINKSHK